MPSLEAVTRSCYQPARAEMWSASRKLARTGCLLLEPEIMHLAMDTPLPAGRYWNERTPSKSAGYARVAAPFRRLMTTLHRESGWIHSSSELSRVIPSCLEGGFVTKAMKKRCCSSGFEIEIHPVLYVGSTPAVPGPLAWLPVVDLEYPSRSDTNERIAAANKLECSDSQTLETPSTVPTCGCLCFGLCTRAAASLPPPPLSLWILTSPIKHALACPG